VLPKGRGIIKLNRGLNRWAISRTMTPGGALTPNRKLETAVIMSRLPRQLESLARMLTYILSHRPDEFGLVLSDEGFIPIKHLLQALSAESGWGFVRRHHLDQVVGLMSPPAFEVVGEQIRALTPGPAHLRRPAGEPPPALLYIAISPKAHVRVWQEGLKPPPERDLVLAATPELALKLGRRRAPNPILVTVQAQAADRRGVSFTAYGEGLYLAPALPRDLLQLPPPPAAPEKPKPEKPRPPAPTPGTFILDLPGMFQPATKWGGRGKKDEPAWKAGTRALRKQREKGEKKKGRKG
jgi:putative RNA 2'-phosphotransferase